MPENKKPRTAARIRLESRIALSVAALAIAIGHVLWPNIQLDAYTAAFLAIALIPWLAFVVKSVEIPGTLKLELQEIRDQARGAAESAKHQAEIVLATGAVAPLGTLGSSRPDEELRTLVEEYKHIRITQPSSPKRTADMTRVVGRMIGVAQLLPDFDVRGALLSTDPGMRLAGYARVYAHPSPAALQPLVQSVTVVETTPFGQYWALRALGAAVSSVGGELSPELRAQLERFHSTLERGTDRDYELGKILAGFDRERRSS